MVICFIKCILSNKQQQNKSFKAVDTKLKEISNTVEMGNSKPSTVEKRRKSVFLTSYG